ncbi:MAG: hypothetical protein ACFFG0_24670 [Candidatus Thorarchaeota archaeon]
MENKNEYPGFIGGFKAGNISTNKSSLLTLTEQILKHLSKLKNDSISFTNSLLIENLEQAMTLLNNTLDINQTPNVLIDHYIKFGNLFKSIIHSGEKNIDKSSIKEITLKYLNIAKYTKDSRIDDIAIDIAKSIED